MILYFVVLLITLLLLLLLVVVVEGGFVLVLVVVIVVVVVVVVVIVILVVRILVIVIIVTTIIIITISHFVWTDSASAHKWTSNIHTLNATDSAYMICLMRVVLARMFLGPDPGASCADARTGADRHNLVGKGDLLAWEIVTQVYMDLIQGHRMKGRPRAPLAPDSRSTAISVLKNAHWTKTVDLILPALSEPAWQIRGPGAIVSSVIVFVIQITIIIMIIVVAIAVVLGARSAWRETTGGRPPGPSSRACRCSSWPAWGRPPPRRRTSCIIVNISLSLSLSLSLYLSIYLSISLSLYIYIYICMYINIHTRLHIYIYIHRFIDDLQHYTRACSVCVSTYIYIHIYIYRYN